VNIYATESEEFALIVQLAKYFSVKSTIIIKRLDMEKRKCVLFIVALHMMMPAIRKVDCVWNVMAHAQKSDFVFRRNGRVHLNQRGRQFSRLLAAEVCASAVVMLDTPCSEVVWRVLATHYICQFPLHFPPPRASPFALHFNWTLLRSSSKVHGIWGLC